MAIVQVDFLSNALMRNVSFKAIIPVDKFDPSLEKPLESKPFKTLYLLHGVFGNDFDWLLETRVKALAEEKNLAVIMPSGENKFYLDNEKSGDRFSTFIGKELVEITRRMFPLSKRREDTFLGGLSMGGYGAFINGLKFNSVFGRLCIFSPALVLEKYKTVSDSSELLVDRRDFFESVFGPYDELQARGCDYYELLYESSKDSLQPEVYLAVGQSDPLINEVRKLLSRIRASNLKVQYEE